MKNSLRIGSLFGIPFQLHYSWFIIFVLLTVTLALYYFPSSWATSTRWILGGLTSLLLFASVLAHELSHSLVAQRRGIPVKSITLFIFGGVAQITREVTDPRTELVMAAAGPLCSLAIAGISFGVYFLIQGFSEHLASVAWYLAFINAILAVFNMIPGFPLDGGRVFRSIVWRATGSYKRATRVASLTGRGFAYAMILGGILIIFLLPGGLFNGIWLIFIGWFLDNAAVQSYRQAMVRESLEGFTAQDVMSPQYPSVPRNLTIGGLVQNYLILAGHRYFLVTDDGVLRGIITLEDIRAIPRERWETTYVSEAMTPVERMEWVSPEEGAMNVLERMVGGDINQIPVVRDGRVIGVIARDILLQFIRTRTKLGM